MAAPRDCAQFYVELLMGAYQELESWDARFSAGRYHSHMTGKQAAEKWLRGAKRALTAAIHMVEAKDYEFALFTCHLSVEKALKGLFVKTHDTRAPKTHNLEELAEECGLDLPEEEKLELRELTTFSEFGRYGDETWLKIDATPENTKRWLERVQYFLSLCNHEK